jgi:hypothetical protein
MSLRSSNSYIPADLKVLADRIQDIDPLLQQFWPPGMRDFRGATWPSKWRGGTYQRNDDPRQMKSLFGNGEEAAAAAAQLRIVGLAPIIVDPAAEPIEGTSLQVIVLFVFAADVPKGLSPWWVVEFRIPESWIV